MKILTIVLSNIQNLRSTMVFVFVKVIGELQIIEKNEKIIKRTVDSLQIIYTE